MTCNAQYRRPVDTCTRQVSLCSMILKEQRQFKEMCNHDDVIIQLVRRPFGELGSRNLCYSPYDESQKWNRIRVPVLIQIERTLSKCRHVSLHFFLVCYSVCITVRHV